MPIIYGVAKGEEIPFGVGVPGGFIALTKGCCCPLQEAHGRTGNYEIVSHCPIHGYLLIKETKRSMVYRTKANQKAMVSDGK
jgi:hypothetical protein